MYNKLIRFFFVISFSFFAFIFASAQSNLIDQVVAIVGNDPVLLSDIESQYVQYGAQHSIQDTNFRCKIFENLLSQKLFINQARVDSLEVTESQVENQLNQRLDYFIKQAGSQQKLEEYFKKSVLEIKEDFRDMIKEQLLTQKMQSQVAEDIKVTPSDVRSYYSSVPKDSLPFINSQVEIQQIAVYPPYSEKAIFEVKQRLLDLRKRIINGESFATLAVLYSEDPGTSTKGGELGLMSKGELDPQYAGVAFSLKKDGVSKIVESQFGFHIIQLIDRVDDRVNTRHILLKPKVSPDLIVKSKLRLDSIVVLIKTGKMKFEQAATFYSQDEDSRMNGGMLINKATNSTKFDMDQLKREDYYSIKDLKTGVISEPFESVDDKGNKVYKVELIKTRSKPHRANLKDDYNLIEEMAIGDRRNTILANWVTDKQKVTYIHIDDSYKGCGFLNNGWIK